VIDGYPYEGEGGGGARRKMAIIQAQGTGREESGRQEGVREGEGGRKESNLSSQYSFASSLILPRDKSQSIYRTNADEE
jgi:hypothetical protein